MSKRRRKYHRFSVEDAEKLKKKGEELAVKGFVKTEGFEKVVVLLMTMTQAIWKLSQKHKSFRMELFYDAETLNTNYCFFTPTDKDESNSKNQEF